MPLRRSVPHWVLAALLAAATLLAGCATAPGSVACSPGDPLEPMNRRVFAFNVAVDHALIQPVARAYRFVLPEFVRDRVRSVVDNLKEPLAFVNDVLQGRGHAASITAGRFLINSTFGLVGLFDPATALGLARQSGDFGQTLYRWGVPDGPYLVLPLLGPSNLRDSAGLGVDLYTAPVGFGGSPDKRRQVALAAGVADGIDLRARNLENVEQLEADSLDLYAYLRSITRQQRQAVLRDAESGSGTARTPTEELLDPGTAEPSPAARPSASADQPSAAGAGPAGCSGP